ncbi:hypothetical protein BDP27DRAFT_1378720 [Rhodocollybia butyracea]|uniref:Uncharacterized protein n=1 Tax=Rhodocollybia butyracea TaxID=206335 RepID=A0A9P5P3Z4_9AGAR|nr:hypothetical protein BDP27DRAFT_1378720 [Rhodocollybia butyracea]
MSSYLRAPKNAQSQIKILTWLIQPPPISRDCNVSVGSASGKTNSIPGHETLATTPSLQSSLAPAITIGSESWEPEVTVYDGTVLTPPYVVPKDMDAPGAHSMELGADCDDASTDALMDSDKDSEELPELLSLHENFSRWQRSSTKTKHFIHSKSMRHFLFAEANRLTWPEAVSPEKHTGLAQWDCLAAVEEGQPRPPVPTELLNGTGFHPHLPIWEKLRKEYEKLTKFTKMDGHAQHRDTEAVKESGMALVERWMEAGAVWKERKRALALQADKDESTNDMEEEGEGSGAGGG